MVRYNVDRDAAGGLNWAVSNNERGTGRTGDIAEAKLLGTLEKSRFQGKVS